MTPEPVGGASPRDDEQPSASDEGDQLADDQVVEEYVDPDVQSRLWLKAVIPLLQLRSHEPDLSSRVQFAFDLMYIAACERIARILRSDIPADI
ncbi:MAG: hypothetical protein ACP5XB_02420 [Isosphaeraceae bacterium]